MKHKIKMVGLFKYKISGIPLISFDSYWRAKEYLNQL